MEVVGPNNVDGPRPQLMRLNRARPWVPALLKIAIGQDDAEAPEPGVVVERIVNVATMEVMQVDAEPFLRINLALIARVLGQVEPRQIWASVDIKSTTITRELADRRARAEHERFQAFEHAIDD